MSGVLGSVGKAVSGVTSAADSATSAAGQVVQDAGHVARPLLYPVGGAIAPPALRARPADTTPVAVPPPGQDTQVPVEWPPKYYTLDASPAAQQAQITGTQVANKPEVLPMEQSPITYGIVGAIFATVVVVLVAIRWVRAEVSAAAKDNAQEVAAINVRLASVESKQHQMELDLVKHALSVQHMELALSRLDNSINKLVNRIDVLASRAAVPESQSG